MDVDEQLVSNEIFLRTLVDSMIKSLEAIAERATDEETRGYASRVAKLNRDTLVIMDGLPQATETTE